MNKTTIKNKIIDDLLIPEKLLERLIQRAPYTYKVYTIPKRSKGRRTIAQPARETKYIQYWLIENIFNLLPVHESATAYKKGASIKKNILSHVDNEFVSKFDFKDFFTSIKYDHLRKHFLRHLSTVLDEDEINDVLRICCLKVKSNDILCLSVGAPCSPVLSNSIMYEFDELVTDWCKDNGFIYTRYADDLTFSTNTKNSSYEIEPVLRDIIKSLDYPVLKFNKKKTIHLSKKNQRRITGLTISNEGKVSIGRERKREISALIHKYTINLLGSDEILKLQGLLGFAKDAEPLFLSRMRSKYGSQIVECILKKRKCNC